MVDKKRRLSEAEEWYFRLMNDHRQYEKEAFIDGINGINSIIEELQKLYEQTPATDRFARARIISGMKKSNKLKDINTVGDCCFNHIIGLPQRKRIDKPLCDYLVTHDSNASNNSSWPPL